MDVVTLGPVAFSNRDLATIYWLAIFSVCVTAKPNIRASLSRVVRTGSIFLVPLSLYTLWVGALVYGAWQLGWWDPPAIKGIAAPAARMNGRFVLPVKSHGTAAMTHVESGVRCLRPAAARGATGRPR